MKTQYLYCKHSSINALVLLIVLSCACFTNKVYADTPNSQSISIGSTERIESREARKNILKTLSKEDLKTNSMTREQRKQIILDKSSKQAKGSASYNLPSHNPYHEFEFYQAQSFLLNDNDYDGFYHSFSIVFDADFYPYDNHEGALVYAEVYLSQNGGPWLHLYSTEEFTIFGASTEDEFEVITRLANGYDTDHYDILIDLYEVGYSDIVATISSVDTNELYALPLESEDNDIESVYIEEITVEVYEGHGGSMSFILFALMMTAFAMRLIHKNRGSKIFNEDSQKDN